MDDEGLPKARPIAFSDSPRFQRSHNSVFSAAVNPRRNLRSIATLHLFKIKCCVDRLRPPEQSRHNLTDRGCLQMTQSRDRRAQGRALFGRSSRWSNEDIRWWTFAFW